MNTGTVKTFDETTGVGLIAPDSGEDDVLVHIAAVTRSGMRTLSEGQRVAYDLEADRKTGKSAAVNLKSA